MSFMDSIKTCLGKYATFSGRAARSEFWWFMLFIFVAQIVLGYVDRAVFGPGEVVNMASGMQDGMGMDFSFVYQPQPITGLFMLAMLLPNLAVGARRLHDTGRSGWWLLIGLIPLIGIIVLLVFFVSKGNEGENKYGPDPLS